eukprot:GEMP01045954.1.p1 GENE.GEMP01045954.1~~GEMP01045954.1.p1  ORF type:complete len:257 (-),score=41.67 GEMP01045954.1:706-1476(-)
MGAVYSRTVPLYRTHMALCRILLKCRRVTYGSLFGYLMNTRKLVHPTNLYISTDHFFSMASFGTDFARATALDGTVDARASIIQIFYFLTTLIIPSIVIIGCLILWCTPLPVWWWPDIRAHMQSFCAYNTFPVLVMTLIAEQFSVTRFSGYLTHANCESITPLLDALFGHFFEGGCVDFVATAQDQMVPLGACAVVVMLSVSLVRRRIEQLSDLVSATVASQHMALDNESASGETTDSVSTQPLPSVGIDEASSCL